ncbi:hypothetical protein BGP76_03200 [Reichenbachiella sp. MSK19-1]|nr:hypothetical protein BGP76_03200 [Reichenbachiella sp. MSK19-1]
MYLSPVAELKLDKLLEYLNSEWGHQSKSNFLKDLDSAIRRIEKFPESSPKTNLMGGFYKCVISKQTSFYYRIKGLDIEIITLSDNRQNPKELLKEIKKNR